MDYYTRNWLFTLCREIKGIHHAIIFLKTSDQGSYAPVGFYPEEGAVSQELLNAAKTTLSEGKSFVLQSNEAVSSTGEPLDTIGCPLFVDKQLYGVVVVQVSRRIAVKQQAIIEFIQASTIWLNTFLSGHATDDKQQLVTLVELVASCLEHERFEEAATDVVTDLNTRLACERASIGFLHGRSVKVAAVSNSAAFDRKSNLMQDIGEAMYEAMDQGSAITYPQADDTPLLARCHASLHDEYGIGAIVTVPFVTNGKVTGAVLLERPFDRPFDKSTREHVEHIVSIIGPVLAVRHRDEQWLPVRAASACKSFFTRIFGPGHLFLKLSLVAVCLCLCVLTLFSGDFRVTTDARLEALAQRVVVAPQDGYIANTAVRPGDIIHGGDVLGTLDDKDLHLENRKWASQLEQLQTEYRDALARHDRSKVSITNARILQAQAQMHLVHEQLARTKLTAPFDGIIVSGDLSQALGAPVERGQVLFTVAPLNAYRVILKVDERDVGSVKEGQQGKLVLSGLSREHLGFTIEKITPVSIAEEGRTFFQVEAKMAQKSDLLRPGMEGVAKIDIDQRKLIWIVTHRLVNWLRLTLWTIWP